MPLEMAKVEVYQSYKLSVITDGIASDMTVPSFVYYGLEVVEATQPAATAVMPFCVVSKRRF